LDYPTGTHFYFNVNDSDDETYDLLCRFQSLDYSVEIVQRKYGETRPDHVWDSGMIAKMTQIRNHALDLSEQFGAEHLFMVDSDIVFEHANTLKHLIGLSKPIVSPVFWATWGNPKAKQLPNVWVDGQYNTSAIFQNLLRRPGHYPVGGLGAVTLIHKEVWKRGVYFDKIKNVDYLGEDRHFCIRAQVLGFSLTACTCYRLTHLER